MAEARKPRRTRVERGIYRQPNGKYAVCARRAERLHFRTAGDDLTTARRAREELIAALEAGRVPASPRLRLDTVAAHWSKRFEAMMATLERRRELALMSAVGWSPRQVGSLVVGEGAAVGLIGAALGVGLGVALSRLLVGLLSAGDLVDPVVTGWAVGRGLLIGLAIGVLGGIYPAWRVTRRPPAELLGRF